VTLAKGPSFYSHGYLVMDLDGPAASVSYYQDSDAKTTRCGPRRFRRRRNDTAAQPGNPANAAAQWFSRVVWLGVVFNLFFIAMQFFAPDFVK